MRGIGLFLGVQRFQCRVSHCADWFFRKESNDWTCKVWYLPLWCYSLSVPVLLGQTIKSGIQLHFVAMLIQCRFDKSVLLVQTTKFGI